MSASETDTDSDTIVQLAVVILLLGLAVPTLATAHSDAGTPFEFEDSVTVSYSGSVSVGATSTSEGYGGAPTLVNATGTTLVAGTDYSWDSDTGEISFQQTANTTSGESITITYRAYQRTDETELAWSLIAPFMGLFGLFGLLTSVRVLWGYVAEVWDLV